MENKKTAVFRKVPLEDLLDILSQIYEQGFDFIDIVGTPDQEQDTIGIYVYPEYMNSEEEQKNSSPLLLTDDTLDSLL